MIRYTSAFFSTLVILSLAVPGIAQSTQFTLDGETYATGLPVNTLDMSLWREKCPWKIGDGEPPIGANRAYEMANESFREQFGERLTAKVQFIAINNMTVQDEEFPHWRVVFVEQPTAEEMEQRRSPDGRIQIANISYLVFMNGDIEKPKRLSRK